jgi:hypothetical protein
VGEFFRWLGVSRTAFTDSIFSLIDEDGSSALSFGEFCGCVGTFCLFEPRDLLRFVFCAFDKRRVGVIARAELAAHVAALHGVGALGRNEEVAIVKINEEGEGDFTSGAGVGPTMGFGEFAEMHARFPRLLSPAQALQRALMSHTFGHAFWERRMDFLRHRRRGAFYAARGAREAAAEACERRRRAQLRRELGSRWAARWANWRRRRRVASARGTLVSAARDAPIVTAAAAFLLGHKRGRLLDALLAEAAAAIEVAEREFVRRHAAAAAKAREAAERAARGQQRKSLRLAKKQAAKDSKNAKSSAKQKKKKKTGGAAVVVGTTGESGGVDGGDGDAVVALTSGAAGAVAKDAAAGEDGAGVGTAAGLNKNAFKTAATAATVGNWAVGEVQAAANGGGGGKNKKKKRRRRRKKPRSTAAAAAAGGGGSKP